MRAIVVLMGGFRDGAIPPMTEARLELALERRRDEPLILTGRGTVHKAPPLVDGFPRTEAGAAAAWLLERGVPQEHLLLEEASLDTIGSAYCTRQLHVAPAGFDELLIITSRFHMARTRAIWDFVFSDVQREYAAAENRGLSDEALARRAEKEERSLARWEETKRRLGSLAALHDWLFREHEAYAPGLEVAREQHLHDSY